MRPKSAPSVQFPHLCLPNSPASLRLLSAEGFIFLVIQFICSVTGWGVEDSGEICQSLLGRRPRKCQTFSYAESIFILTKKCPEMCLAGRRWEKLQEVQVSLDTPELQVYHLETRRGEEGKCLLVQPFQLCLNSQIPQDQPGLLSQSSVTASVHRSVEI